MADFIDEIIAREGPETSDPADSGGRTKFGISEKAHPEAWADGDVTRDEAREIYKHSYLEAKSLDALDDIRLQHQVVDFGVTAGMDTAIKLLQQVVGAKADGVIGPKTLELIKRYQSYTDTLFGEQISGRVTLNLAFRDARILRYATIAKVRPKDLKFLLGWIKRAQEFK